MKGFEFVSWYGLWGPKDCRRTSRPSCSRNRQVLARPDVKQRLSELGFEPIGSTSDQFAKYIDTEMAKYSKIGCSSNRTPEDACEGETRAS